MTARAPGDRVVGMGTAVALVAYSVLANRRGGSGRWYVARNTAAGALLVAAARRRGLTWDALGLSSALGLVGLRLGVRYALASTVAIVGGVAVAAAGSPGRTLLADRRATLSPREVGWQALVRIPIGTAAFEEIAFRGVLLGLISDRYGPAAGLWVSSATFGLWHVAPTLAALRINEVDDGHVRASAAAVALTTIAGLALGRLRLVAGHVGTPWLVHTATNVSALAAAAVWQRRRRAPAPGPG